mmetsp:Transcript_20755/g.30717  ORF Transcript_20755/g.30717 Transcript_20755/m.30717 type:complete len:259 (+) Transcript_20755:56-832(+)
MISTETEMKEPLISNQSDCPVIIHLDLEDPIERREPSESREESSNLLFPKLSKTRLSQLVYFTGQSLVAMVYLLLEEDGSFIDLSEEDFMVILRVVEVLINLPILVFLSNNSLALGEQKWHFLFIYLTRQSIFGGSIFLLLRAEHIPLPFTMFSILGIAITCIMSKFENGCQKLKWPDTLSGGVVLLGFVAEIESFISLALLLVSIVTAASAGVYVFRHKYGITLGDRELRSCSIYLAWQSIFLAFMIDEDDHRISML